MQPMLNPLDVIEQHHKTVFKKGKWKGKTFEWVHKYHPGYVNRTHDEFFGYTTLYYFYRNISQFQLFSSYTYLISRVHLDWVYFNTNLEKISKKMQNVIWDTIDHKSRVCKQIHEVVPKLNLWAKYI